MRLFERRWPINLILFGNYKRLCNEVVKLVGENTTGSTLQIVCVYGDLTQRLACCHQQRGQFEKAGANLSQLHVSQQAVEN